MTNDKHAVDSGSTDVDRRLESLFGTDSPVAFITGSGAPRVGRAIADCFASSGYSLVIHSNQSNLDSQTYAQYLSDRGIANLLVQGDLREESIVQSWFEKIDDRFGRIDVMVNSAAIWNPSRLLETEVQSVRDHFDVNTLGPWLCARESGRRMVNQPNGGAIIFIADWAIARPYQNFAAYFPSKGAIETMARSFAVELATLNPNIRVNTILPGPILLADDTPDEVRSAIRRQSLLKRDGTAEHVARTVQFLVEHEFLTGVSIPIDGGRSIFAPTDNDAIANAKARKLKH